MATPSVPVVAADRHREGGLALGVERRSHDKGRPAGVADPAGMDGGLESAQVVHSLPALMKADYFPMTVPAGSISSRSILRYSGGGVGLTAGLPGIRISKLLLLLTVSTLSPGCIETSSSLLVSA